MARDKKTARGSDEPQPQEEMTVIVLKFKGGGTKAPSTPKYTFMDEFELSPEGKPSLKD